MATRTSKLTRTIVEIVETDRREAVAAAEAATIAQATELAPLGYADLAGIPAAQLGAHLVDLADELVRPLVVRYLAERFKANGKGWGWNTVDAMEAWLREQIAAARAEALRRRIGAAQAAKIKEVLMVGERIETAAATVVEVAPVVEAEPQPAVPTPAQVAQACRAMAEKYRDAATAAEQRDMPEAAKDLRAAARAADKAAFHALAGERVARWVGDTLMVCSATTGGTVYAVGRAGCVCKAAAGGRPCWHGALRQGWERALDNLEAGYEDEAAYELAA